MERAERRKEQVAKKMLGGPCGPGTNQAGCMQGSARSPAPSLWFSLLFSFLIERLVRFHCLKLSPKFSVTMGLLVRWQDFGGSQLWCWELLSLYPPALITRVPWAPLHRGGKLNLRKLQGVS